MADDLITKAASCPDLDECFLCFADPSPSLNTLRRIFTALTMYMFSNPDTLADYKDILKCRLYDKDKALSQITILPQSVEDPANTEDVPGIFISLKEGTKFSKLGLDSVLKTGRDYARSNLIWQASADITFTCKDWDASVACDMADAILLFFSAVSLKLRDTLRWVLDYYPTMETEPQLKTASQENTTGTKWYESTVVFHIDYSYNLVTTRESVPLRDGGIQAAPAGIPAAGEAPIDGLLHFAGVDVTHNHS